MNNICLIGRICNDIDMRNANGIAVARYTLAVDRVKDGTDFVSCVAFGKGAEFVQKYLKKGAKIGVTGRLQTGSYEKNGVKHYTADVIVSTHDFCDGKAVANNATTDSDGFMDIPDSIGDELPFH